MLLDATVNVIIVIFLVSMSCKSYELQEASENAQMLKWLPLSYKTKLQLYFPSLWVFPKEQSQDQSCTFYSSQYHSTATLK